VPAVLQRSVRYGCHDAALSAALRQRRAPCCIYDSGAAQAPHARPITARAGAPRTTTRCPPRRDPLRALCRAVPEDAV